MKVSYDNYIYLPDGTRIRKSNTGGIVAHDGSKWALEMDLDAGDGNSWTVTHLEGTPKIGKKISFDEKRRRAMRWLYPK